MNRILIFILIGFIVVSVLPVAAIYFFHDYLFNSKFFQPLIFTKFKYVYEYQGSVFVKGVKVGKLIEFNELTIHFGNIASFDKSARMRFLDSVMVIEGASYPYSQITPDILKRYGAEDCSNTKYPNSFTWVLERTMGINPGYDVVWGFIGTDIDDVGIHIQHPPDSAKGKVREVPIQFSIDGSELIHFPIKEQELVRILGKPEKITKEPLFP
jgi:hypothetical protein